MSGHQPDISGNQIGAGAFVNQGDMFGTHLNFYNTLPPPQQGFAIPAQPAPCIIPYPRNLEVVPRPDLSKDLQRVLSRNHRRAALWGLGGSGKTQIALEYAYSRFEREGPNACAIFWVHADSSATFAHDYMTIATELGVDTNLGERDLFRAVCHAIDAQPCWVLVIDNADDLSIFGVLPSSLVLPPTEKKADLQEYMPRSDRGTILWTSRDGRIAEVVGLRQAIQVKSMSVSEATQLLAAELDAAEADRASMEPSDTEREDRQTLLKELEWLPLAVSQAAVYMRRTWTTISEYLVLLRQQQQRWHVLTASQHDRHRRPELPNGVLDTWNISVNRIRQDNQSAYRILCVIAFIHHQHIPLDILSAASGDDTGNEPTVREAIARLREFSFLSLHRAETGQASFEMHKLLQEASRYSLRTSSSKGETHFTILALEIVTKLFPFPSAETFDRCEEHLVHALAVAEWADTIHRSGDAATLLKHVSFFLSLQGRERELEGIAMKVLRINRETLGERHSETIDWSTHVALLAHNQGRLQEAEQLLMKTLGVQIEEKGEKHPKTLRMKSILGLIYRSQGRRSEEFQQLTEVLHTQTKRRGKTHPDTMATKSLLAWTHGLRKEFDMAVSLETDVLDTRRRMLGERHPDTLQSMRHLVVYYQDQGRYGEAEKLANEVLSLRREVLGEKHPATLKTMADLGAIYSKQERYAEAEDILTKSLQSRLEVLGGASLDTLANVQDLAVVFLDQGLVEKAKQKISETLKLMGQEQKASHVLQESLSACCSPCVFIPDIDLEAGD